MCVCVCVCVRVRVPVLEKGQWAFPESHRSLPEVVRRKEEVLPPEAAGHSEMLQSCQNLEEIVRSPNKSGQIAQDRAHHHLLLLLSQVQQSSHHQMHLQSQQSHPHHSLNKDSITYKVHSLHCSLHTRVSSGSSGWRLGCRLTGEVPKHSVYGASLLLFLSCRLTRKGCRRSQINQL